MKRFGKTRGMKDAKGTKLLKALKIAAGVLVCTVLLVTLVWSIFIRKPEVPQIPMSTQDPLITLAPDEQYTPPTTGIYRREDTWTFLVVGMDDGDLRETEDLNTDTMMLGTLDLVKGELNIVSLPRDTLVNVPWDIKKVNSYLFERGTRKMNIDALLSGIRDLVGFSVDYYAIVNLAAFEEIVDAIGGVDFDVPVDMYYYDFNQVGSDGKGLEIELRKGFQHLDGEAAMGLVRFRGYPMADIQRIETQQAFLIAAAKQMLNLGSLFKIPEFVDIASKNLNTNVKATDMIWFIEQLLKFSPEDIHFTTMPANYSAEIYGLSYVSVLADEWVAMINEKLNPFFEQVTRDKLNLLLYENGQVAATSGEIAGGLESFRFYRPW